jgi:VanZ family protein
VNPLPALKPLRRPRLWLALWWSGVAVVVACSLVPAFLLPQVPDGGDKVEHFASYFLLAAAAVQLFRPRMALLRAGPGLVAMGIALEIAQGLLTTTRQMDPSDALANSLGVACGLLTLLTPWRDLLLRWTGGPSSPADARAAPTVD